ncbi:iron-regulated protein [Escherichia alba]|uniref:Iron-regulated protein n=1 Tax=Intestinirhabdus alba TaxID=2899544 RepID=A0A6L6IP50_9ENTR|nr:ChaN family lipoprotein [Intestinirhabdus alba]MTH48621.1 iron-regulated protein [Intestinirhabdus alba]
MFAPFIKVQVLCICSVILMSACHQHDNVAKKQILDIERTGRIQDLRTGRTLNSLQLADILAVQQYVIVGEKHDNFYHHQAEYWLMKKLSDNRPQGSVLMEMIDSDQQSRVDQVKSWIKNVGDVRNRRVRELLRWNEKWPWEMYEDVVIQAMRSPYPLLSANISDQQVNTIYTHPYLPEGQLSSRREVRDAIRNIIVDMHDGELPEDKLGSMLAVQQQRDRVMAKQLIAAPAPAFLIAGGYHAARNTGVPLHIHDLAPQILPTVLILAEEGMQITSEHADYVWYFPVSTEVQTGQQ